MLNMSVMVTVSAKEALSTSPEGRKEEKFQRFLVRLDEALTNVVCGIIGVRKDYVSFTVMVPSYSRRAIDLAVLLEGGSGFIGYPPQNFQAGLEKALKELLADSDNADLTVSVTIS